MLDEIRRLWKHAKWADQRLLGNLAGAGAGLEPAQREFAHILGTAETWLSRLERRASLLAVWPEIPASTFGRTVSSVHAGYDAFLDRLTPDRLADPVAYRNSAGQSFENRIGDILLHAALHGQYHRGKVNLLLRQAGIAPAPADYIAFVRGVPAATSQPR